MPRTGTSVAEQTAGGSGFRIDDGNVEVVAAKHVIDQVQTNPPRVCLALTVRYWTPKWDSLDNREEVTENLSCGPVYAKDGSRKFGIGLADSADDADPELEIGGAKDAGEEVETEGNCLLSATGAGPDKKSKMSIFSMSLEEHGFPAALNNGYAGNYIGLKLHVSRLKLERGENYTGKEDPTALICGLNGQVAGGSIMQMPGQEPKYAKGKTPMKAANKGAAADTGRTVPAATPRAAQKSAVAGTDSHGSSGQGSSSHESSDIADNTRFALAKVGETRPGQSMSLTKLATIVQTTALPQMMKDIPLTQHKQILANIKSAGWMGIMVNDGLLPGWVIDGDGANTTVTFPSGE